LSRIVVIGDQLLEDLFDDSTSALGQKVRISGKTFKITGVIDGSSSTLVPLPVAQKILFGHDYLNSISVGIIDNNLMEITTSDIENLLLSRHQISDPDNADFSLRNALEMMDTVSSMTGTLTTVLSGIAAISLLVGGIGIMNIMLVTVTERTRDIGLLKAIGAKSKDILAQF